ncbi:MAG: type II toxin-antitoxin system prevent-host-death family antitoxin [Micropruina sp.]|uniref:type II toxin-antitoxin system Phd/YefM family antitoxin n=1 Tax=Micropruina sp. TaxID=2737536 RepID=UPI0039E3CB9A
MTTVASRDLRNHTAAVLRQVAEGTDVTVTLNGRPVARITRPLDLRPSTLSRAELVRLRSGALPDPGLRADLAWISDDTTDDLGDPS